MSEATPQSRTGRIVVTALFLAFTGYCVVAVVGSMLRDLYAQPPPAAESGLTKAERTWCARRIAGLRSELESRASQFLQKPDATQHARWEHWHTEWSQQLEEVRAHCSGQHASLSAAYERLEELHGVYLSAVSGVMRARTELAREINDLLERL